MKLTPLRVLLRPISTAWKLLKVLRTIELKPVVALTPLPKGWELSTDIANVLVRVETGNILMTAATYEAIKHHLIRLDYDYIGSGRVWKLHNDQKISTEMLKAEHLTAMRVAQKLER